MIRRRAPKGIARCILSSLLIAVCLFTTGAWAAEPSGELAAVETLLRSTIEEGHRVQSVEKVLSAYAPDAAIVSPTGGQLSRDEFGELLRQDFDSLAVRKVRLDLLEVEMEGISATVLLNLSVSGDLPLGVKANRHDRAWLELRKGREGWRVFRQSYRKDFGVTVEPHDFSR